MTESIVTEKWLRSIGFTDCGDFALRIEIPNKWTNACKSYLVCGDFPNAADCPWEVHAIYRDGTKPDRAMLISELPTQGEVLTLCRVLRIRLTEKQETQSRQCRICGGMGSIEDEDGVWICPCYEAARPESRYSP